ncbi:MAG: hypothetical protein AAGA54_31000 [Myxococcota bacterium]
MASLALGACDNASGGAVGAPCNSADDCQSDLICDEHNGQASCQEPHGHGTEGEESESDSHDHESESDSHDHESESDSHDHESESDSHDHESESDTHDHDTDHHDTDGHDTDHHDTDGHETDGHDTDHDDTDHDHTEGDTAGSELCEAFCTCMEANCASYDAYPYADSAECMTACEALDDVTLSCFGGFCEQAGGVDGGLAEHYCEHAWGQLGSDKC